MHSARNWSIGINMTKKFFEVFPTFKLERTQKDDFEPVEVQRVLSTAKKDFLRIYIYSERLIPKEIIFAVERQIEKQSLSQFSMQVKMYERYKLSAQYNLQKLMDVYLDSIMLEVREYDHILHNVLRKAQLSYPDEKTIHMCVEDTVLARGKMPELTRILEKIIGERCGLDVVLQEEYRVPEETGRKEEEERRIEMEVAQIAARMKGASGEEGQEAQPAASAESKPEAGGTKGASAPSEGGAAGGRQKKGDFVRPVKRSDNPDVLYGRVFEGETMRMDEILG